MNPQPPTHCDSATVRVMKSHDYCHFEIVLGLSAEPGVLYPFETVDNLRKAAARMADKAVEQYKVKKRSLMRQENSVMMRDTLRAKADGYLKIPEADRTPDEQATIKAYQDHVYEANRPYDYQDDWDENP